MARSRYRICESNIGPRRTSRRASTWSWPPNIIIVDRFPKNLGLDSRCTVSFPPRAARGPNGKGASLLTGFSPYDQHPPDLRLHGNRSPVPGTRHPFGWLLRAPSIQPVRRLSNREAHPEIRLQTAGHGPCPDDG